jgi:hypothetical protein
MPTNVSPIIMQKLKIIVKRRRREEIRADFIT